MSTHVIDQDELLTFAQVAAILPRRRNGAKIALSTLWRWSRRGSRGVFLRVTRIGGSVYVSRGDLAEFIRRSSASDQANGLPPPNKQKDATAKRLAELGL